MVPINAVDKRFSVTRCECIQVDNYRRYTQEERDREIALTNGVLIMKRYEDMGNVNNTKYNNTLYF